MLYYLVVYCEDDDDDDDDDDDCDDDDNDDGHEDDDETNQLTRTSPKRFSEYAILYISGTERYFIISQLVRKTRRIRNYLKRVHWRVSSRVVWPCAAEHFENDHRRNEEIKRDCKLDEMFTLVWHIIDMLFIFHN